jgi:hypothetical protein
VAYSLDGGTTTATATLIGGTATVTILGVTASQTLTLVNVADVNCSTLISGSSTVTVNPLPTVTISSYGSVCADAADITLVGSPIGGTFSGTGVTGNNFDPSVGTQTITYFYTDANSCSASATTTITVNPLPVVTFTGTLTAQCLSSTTYALTDGSPAGGTYSGAGVTGSNFDASAVGVGTHTITYTYTDGNSCVNTATNTIMVNPIPTASAGGTQTICSNGTATVSGTSSSNGTISWTHNGAGTLTNAGTLAPSYTAAVGDAGNTVTLTLTVSNAPCVDATATY